LLVVIAIIGILAGMVFPVFAKAREKGRQAVCMSNLKQISLAMLMYMDDHAGRYVAAMSPDNLTRWHGRRLSEEDAFNPNWGPLWGYYHHESLKLCPSFSPDDEAQGFEQGTGGYGYNDQYVGGTPAGFPKMCTPAREFEISNPVETVMLTDTAFLDCEGRLFEYSFAGAPYYEVWAWPAEPSTHFRHNGLTNVAFCDGHARAMPMVYTHTSGSCPSVEGTRTEDDYREGRFGFVSEDNSLYDRR
jgi:prepilin-type processing-associated H-X9-DG protein